VPVVVKSQSGCLSTTPAANQAVPSALLAAKGKAAIKASIADSMVFDRMRFVLNCSYRPTPGGARRSS
jgi:hypothetical protein